MIRKIVLSGIMFLFPIVSYAAQVTTWDFRSGQLPGQWTLEREMTFEPTEQGLHIQSEQTGAISRSTADIRPFDVITFSYSLDKTQELSVLWKDDGVGDGEWIAASIVFPAREERTFSVDMRRFPGWNANTSKIGLVVPQNADIIIHSIAFTRLSLLEEVVEAWRSFWTFYPIAPTSINFLWGPLLAFSAPARESMFYSVPPKGDSANIVFYIVLLCTLAWLVWRWWRTAGLGVRWYRSLLLFWSVTLGLWILYDVRMGAEFLNYARRDFSTYWSKSVPQREFRSRGNLHDFVASAVPFLAERSKYVLLQEDKTMEGYVRYATYPALPVAENTAGDIDTWVVYRRSDVALNAANELTLHGTVIAPAGHIVLQFDENSFVFRSDPS